MRARAERGELNDLEEETQMTRDALLKKLDRMLEGIERAKTYGTVEIEFRAGEPMFLRKTEQEKLDGERENPREQAHRRY